MSYSIECPHCDYEDQGAYECLPDHADDWEELQCGRCEKMYKIKWNAYFTTKKVED